MDTTNNTAQVHGTTPYHMGYLLDNRIFSYAHQLQTALAGYPTNALEVGVGCGVVAGALRATGISVTTLDVEPTLNPDVVASVLCIPAANDAFDVSICCQVLEHIPLEKFSDALRELKRVTRSGLVLSLPDKTRYFYLFWRLPKMRARRIELSLPFSPPLPLPPANHEKNGHHWEIGYKGCSLQQITRIIEDVGWSVDRSWRVPEKPWHRCFDLRPNQ